VLAVVYQLPWDAEILLKSYFSLRNYYAYNYDICKSTLSFTAWEEFLGVRVQEIAMCL